MKQIKYLLVFGVLIFTMPLRAIEYYVNSNIGKDTNDGLSEESPFKSLKQVNELRLSAGDKVLLANGFEYKGYIEIENVSGKSKQPIIIGNYGAKADALPLINAQGYRNGILLTNCNNITIQNIAITANGGGVFGTKKPKNDMRCGVLVRTTKIGDYKGIVLSNLDIKDVFYAEQGLTRSFKETHSPNGTQAYGWGIRFINRIKGATMQDLKVHSCSISNVAHTGLKFTGVKQSLSNVEVLNNSISHTGGPGMQMSGVVNAYVSKNKVNFSGSTSDSRKWGRGSGFWTWSCSKMIIEHNSFRNANGPGDSAGCHIDYNCNDIIVQYNLSENNAGGFCEILGNNYNCAYRYNISINDGHRVKKKGVAFQEGKIFWLSGYNGEGKPHKGPYNSYFYNNTIYVRKDIEAKLAITRSAEGVLIANNIFYIEGESKLVLGDQYKPEEAGESLIDNVMFKNNLFLNESNWPKNAPIQDECPTFGDPEFNNVSGKNATDFKPQQIELIKDKGIQINSLPGDKKGLFKGTRLKHDILGNTIKGLPDMGAIELK